MSSVNFYFQVHQPRRVKRYKFFDIGNDSQYFNDSGDRNTNNVKVLRKVAEKSYLPANAVMLELLQKHPKFKISYSISGVALDQFEESAPEVIESFKRLADTGRVEFLGETYFHSLAFLRSPSEFMEQAMLHRAKIERLFGHRPRVFRNTELIYRNDLAPLVAKMGYEGMLAEGHDHILGWRSPNFLYHSVDNPKFKLLLKNYRLSDDIAFRFGERSWSEWPLTAPKFGQWVSSVNGSGDVINLFMDYETFGEHQWESTGIFDFLRALPEEVLRHPDNDFVTPSEAIQRFPAVGSFDAPYYVSWADVERDLSAWMSNPMQHDAHRAVYDLEPIVRQTGDAELIKEWRHMQTSDHFYYMCTKWFADGDVHAYFNPYETPYQAFISYMNALADLRYRVLSAKRPLWRRLVHKLRERWIVRNTGTVY